MSRVATRVLEVCPGEWVCRFEGGVNGWTTFSDTFASNFEAEQIASADLGDAE